VTRKITSGVARIKLGLDTKLALGNLDAKRDWGHAEDYVTAMHAMLQQPEADNYVVATGTTHSVRDFCDFAFAEAGLDYRDYVEVDQSFYRPAEVDLLLGNASKAREKLGWRPKRTFREMIREMVQNDIQLLSGSSRLTTAASAKQNKPSDA
jgi:GDPmannose 4,6-dehydratase